MDNVLGKFATCRVVDICNVEPYVLMTETNCNVIDVDDIKVTWSAGTKDYGVTGKHS